MWFEGNTVGKTNSYELDMFEELKAVEKMNLFAIFPIGATMQDGGKRKRSAVIVSHTVCGSKHVHLSANIKYICAGQGVNNPMHPLKRIA